MLTKERIKELVAELTAENVAALIRCEAGKPFSGRVPIGRLRELGLVEKASWNPTEDGRQVVGELVGISYKPAPQVVGTPSRSSKSKGKFTPREGAEATAAVSNRETICFQCREEIPKGSRVIWVADEGIFHTDCVETS